jgi:ubiquinone/menaquinone biosynthesis C-methylase UbiE
MFSYVFMKILEMRPASYDQQMDKASSGRIRIIKQAVAKEVTPGSRVLEIGCGTGELAEMMIARNCHVQGFDLSPSMVKVAKNKIETKQLNKVFSVQEMGVEGMDKYPDADFDAVVSTLVFSELNPDERRFAIKHAVRALKPGGHFIIADEVVPGTRWKRWLHALVRLPMLIVTYLVSGNATRPIPDLAEEIRQSGISIEKEERLHGDAFAVIVGQKPKK